MQCGQIRLAPETSTDPRQDRDHRMTSGQPGRPTVSVPISMCRDLPEPVRGHLFRRWNACESWSSTGCRWGSARAWRPHHRADHAAVRRRRPQAKGRHQHRHRVTGPLPLRLLRRRERSGL